MKPRKTEAIFIRILFFIVPLLLFSACMVYGDNIARGYTNLTKDTIHTPPAQKPVVLFFEGEPIKFSYDKLGLVEVKGDPGAKTEDLLGHLRYEAYKNGANAVIGVKDGYVTRESGVLFSKTPPTEYNSHLYSGIAIKINDSTLYSQVDRADTSFITKAKQYDATYTKKSTNQTLSSLFVALLLTVIIVVAVVTR